MATFLTEVCATSPELKNSLTKVLSWFNASQSAFRTEILDLPDDSLGSLKNYIADRGVLDTGEVYSLLRKIRSELRGTHDRQYLRQARIVY